MKKQLLILITLFISFIGYSQTVGDTFVEDFITYEVTTISPNTVEITGYNTAGGTAVTIPEIVINNSISYSVTSVGINAFNGNNLTNVTFALPSNITSIKLLAFSNNDITSIIIPDSVVNIDDIAFAYNALMTAATIGNGVTSIGGSAFADNQLTNVVIPNSVISIGNSAFQNNALITATIGNSVMSIGVQAFFNNQITSLAIPNSVTSIGTSAFASNLLSSITIPNNLTSIGQSSFSNNQLLNVIIPDNVTNIGAAAFKNNQLSNITIHSNITSIGNQAFRNNPLVSVISEATTPPTIFTGGIQDSFNSDRSTIHLHIPAGIAVMDAYVNDVGALWTGFNLVTQDAGLSVSDFELTYDIKVITTQDGINITSSKNVRLETYALYSITGSKVVIGSESEISTSFLSSGIYIIKLDFDKGIVVKKIVVK